MSAMISALLLAFLGALQAQEAIRSQPVLRDGDVYLAPPGGSEVRVTLDGSYTEATISPQRKYLAVIRRPQGKHPELVIHDANPAQPKEIFAIRGKVAVEAYHLPVHGTLAWSTTGESLYFLLDFSATSAYLARWEVASRRVKPMCPAITYVVVRSGQYLGKLAALRRKHTLVFPWEWYWLIDDNCAEIGPIGDEFSLSEFFDRYGGGSPDPPRPRRQ